MPEATERLGSFVRAGVRDPLILLVVGAYLAGFGLHAVSIWLLPLYLAQAAISLSMPCTAVLSVRQLHEPLGPARWTAVGAVTLGIALLALGAGSPGAVTTSWAFAAWVVAGLVVVTAAGVAARSSGPLLGALAGCGYAGSALAVRGIGSGALRAGPGVRPRRTRARAGGVLALLPGAVPHRRGGGDGRADRAADLRAGGIGVAFLGDGVRDGWWPAIVAGLVLGVGGAVALRASRSRPMTG